MQNLERKCGVATPVHLPCEDVIASVAKDFSDLSAVLDKLSTQRSDLDGRQADFLVRASAAAARGIELSNRLRNGRG